MAGFVAAQIREAAYAGRYVIVVDDDIDPTNTNDVLWAMSTRSDPATDIDFIRRAWSTALDPMVRPARKPWSTRARSSTPAGRTSGCPSSPRSPSPAELQEQIRQKWAHLF